MGKTKLQKDIKKSIKKARKILEKAKNSKPVTRLSLPPNKRHKTKKDYKRKNKVKAHEVEME
jgi:hypothetical protein